MKAHVGNKTYDLRIGSIVKVKRPRDIGAWPGWSFNMNDEDFIQITSLRDRWFEVGDGYAYIPKWIVAIKQQPVVEVLP
jgi:hypothetical protein